MTDLADDCTGELTDADLAAMWRSRPKRSSGNQPWFPNPNAGAPPEPDTDPFGRPRPIATPGPGPAVGADPGTGTLVTNTATAAGPDTGTDAEDAPPRDPWTPWKAESPRWPPDWPLKPANGSP